MTSVADFMARAPHAATTGQPNASDEWGQRWASEMLDHVHRYANRAPRNIQRTLGPSEIGVACDRQVAGKLAHKIAPSPATARTNHVSSPWPSIVGTAIHAWLAEMLAAEPERWLVETRVPVPGYPGTCDLYDRLHRTVVDHKCLGGTALAGLRRNGPKRAYFAQLMLYGLGLRVLGEPVERVAIMAWPRTESHLANAYLWSHVVTPEDWAFVAGILTQDMPRRRQQAAHILAGGSLLDIPAIPSDADCFFCPFYRPEAAGIGCPGIAMNTTH